MKKLFILVIILLFSIVSMGQLKNAGVFKIQNSTQTFDWNVPAGTIIIDLSNGDTYRSIAPIASTGTITTALNSLVIDSTCVDIVDFGALNDGVTDNTTAIQAAIDHAIATQGVLISSKGGDFVTGNLVLDSPENTVINLSGVRLILDGTASGDGLGLEIRGDATGLVIKNTIIIGDDVTTNKHMGIWSTSGATLSNIEIYNNRMSGVVDGIFLDASSAGSIVNTRISDNEIHIVNGTGIDQGYGIYWTYPSSTGLSVVCKGNTISRTQYHAIFCNETSYSKIFDNYIYSHASIPGGSLSAAINIIGSSYVEIVGNSVVGFYDGAINVAESDVDDKNSDNVVIKDNYLRNKNNAIPFLTISEIVYPKTYNTNSLTVEGNIFYQDCDIYNDGVFVAFNGGDNISFNGNEFTLDDTKTISYSLITYGSTSISTNNDFTNVLVFNNAFKVTGNYSGVTIFDVKTYPATNTSRHTFYDNRRLSSGTEIKLFTTDVTNFYFVMNDELSQPTLGEILYNSGIQHDCSKYSIGGYYVETVITELEIELLNLKSTRRNSYMGTLFIESSADNGSLDLLTPVAYSDNGVTALTVVETNTLPTILDPTEHLIVTYTIVDNENGTIVYVAYKIVT